MLIVSYARGSEAFGALRRIAEARVSPAVLLLADARTVVRGGCLPEPGPGRGAVGVRPCASCGCRARTEARTLLDALSARELEVLALAGDGLSNAEIARNLTISPETAKDHLHSIYGKLGVRGRLQAAKIAWQAGITGGGPSGAP
ncbi:LuxR C-terminal-related transcriptional regulator [Streptomyces sp. NPDC047079]|uniref:helix-turn-helix transcriptional regulator n=1 Tax=Streptomyces sp. NPDC047079 TaxID=3154607 RepID=UPI0033F56895